MIYTITIILAVAAIFEGFLISRLMYINSVLLKRNEMLISILDFFNDSDTEQ